MERIFILKYKRSTISFTGSRVSLGFARNNLPKQEADWPRSRSTPYMGRKERPQFAVGAYWLKGHTETRFGTLHGISLWQIVEKQSKGQRILKKIEQLESGRINWGSMEGQTKQISCADLNKFKHWMYVKNPDTVRTLYGN